jgi:hypothetical protein
MKFLFLLAVTMAKTFFQEASHAAAYSIYRPNYTEELSAIITKTLSKSIPPSPDVSLMVQSCQGFT